MKPRLGEFALRYLIVCELSTLPTFRSGFAFDLFHDGDSWKAIPTENSDENAEFVNSLRPICARLRSKFDLQVFHQDA
jgi:hypothetical protein